MRKRYQIFVDGVFVCWMEAESALDAEEGYYESVRYHRPDVTLNRSQISAKE